MGVYCVNYYTEYTKKGRKEDGEKMEEFDLKYFELFGLAEEANEEMRRLMNALPQLSNEIYSISAKLINN